MNALKSTRAYALIYVLIITTIIALLCSFLLLRMAYAWQLEEKWNVRSEIIHSNENLKRFVLNRHFVLDTFQKPKSSLSLNSNIKSSIKFEQWGIFPFANFMSQAINDSILEMAFLGVENQTYSSTALYLADNNLPLSISGNAQIIGNAYLPASGVRSGMVNGQSFKGKIYVQGNTFKSESILPEINLTGLNAFIDQVENNEFEIMTFEDKIERSFKEKAVLIDLGTDALLENCSIKGKVILYASESIFVAKSALVEDVIIISPNIEIEEGAKLSAQLLATEAIEIERNVLLSYPSLLYLKREDESESKITIGSQCTIEGLVICLQENPKSRKPIARIEKDAELNGVAYVNGILEMQGNIDGTLYCENLQYSARGSLYLSYLVDSRLNNNALPKYLSFPNLFVSKQNKRIIKWLD